MGDFTEHILFGFLTAALILVFADEFLSLNATVVSTSILMIAIGSILPDIDHKNSYVHRSVKAFTSLFLGLLAFLLLPLQPQQRYGIGVLVFATVFLLFHLKKIRHRGFTHSITFSAIVASVATIASVVLAASWIPGAAMGIGLFSHLLLDREIKLE